jgi:hypothetical protein
MSKSKLEILLEEVGKLTLPPLLGDLANAYQAYMEERKKLPQQGDLIEVKNVENQDWQIRKFIGFKINGEFVTENEFGYVGTWKHYRIPTPKKKWNVVKNSDGVRFVQLAERSTDLPIITTFED